MTGITSSGPARESSDWAGSPLSTLHRPTSSPYHIPTEHYIDGNSYVIRLELPGIEPNRDLGVCVQNGILNVEAERRDKNPGKHDSEFHYGTFARRVALPAGADAENVSATYHEGILTIRIRTERQHGTELLTIPVETL